MSSKPAEDATSHSDQQPTPERSETQPPSIKNINNSTAINNSNSNRDEPKPRSPPAIDPALEQQDAPKSKRASDLKPIGNDSKPSISDSTTGRPFTESLRELLDLKDPPLSPTTVSHPSPSPYPPYPPFTATLPPESEHRYHQMPHRVEPYPMHPSHHRRHQYSGRPSPPPIATLSHTHSPSPSISSVSTPPLHHRRSPPLSAPLYYPSHDMIPPPPPQRGYGSYHPHAYPPYPPYTGSMGPVAGGPIIYTEDASTKLSDRVRRRCFNCCTTDTSTWRRSNLSPGKVLCNKCGLFERTHSRPRPDQFPHKRGPLSGSNLRAPGAPGGRSPPQQLPPISPPYTYQNPHPHPDSASAAAESRENFSLPSVNSWELPPGAASSGGSHHTTPGSDHMQLPPLSSVAAGAVSAGDA